ncbi:hypothetical protein [Vibrio casei]|uniref:hypothetical protein n=1 Tax=Vibrio casei TaxID=673372 RepID=UPI003F9A93FC
MYRTKVTIDIQSNLIDFELGWLWDTFQDEYLFCSLDHESHGDCSQLIQLVSYEDMKATLEGSLEDELHDAI